MQADTAELKTIIRKYTGRCLKCGGWLYSDSGWGEASRIEMMVCINCGARYFKREKPKVKRCMRCGQLFQYVTEQRKLCPKCERGKRRHGKQGMV